MDPLSWTVAACRGGRLLHIPDRSGGLSLFASGGATEGYFLALPSHRSQSAFGGVVGKGVMGTGLQWVEDSRGGAT